MNPMKLLNYNLLEKNIPAKKKIKTFYISYSTSLNYILRIQPQKKFWKATLSYDFITAVSPLRLVYVPFVRSVSFKSYLSY